MQPAAQALVVSPDPAVLRAAECCLLRLGHAPLLSRTVVQAQRIAKRVHADLVCLDCVLLSGEIERFWRWLRSAQGEAVAPVLLVAPPSLPLTPAALPSFFRPERDGIVSKPLEAGPLAREFARLLSRRPAQQRVQEMIQVGELTLDTVVRELLLTNGSLRLTPTEFRFLRYLMQRPGEFVSAQVLLEQVWGHPSGLGGVEIVRSHVSNLRRKLRAAGEDPALVRTIPYRGYAVLPDDRAAVS